MPPTAATLAASLAGSNAWPWKIFHRIWRAAAISRFDGGSAFLAIILSDSAEAFGAHRALACFTARACFGRLSTRVAFSYFFLRPPRPAALLLLVSVVSSETLRAAYAGFPSADAAANNKPIRSASFSLGRRLLPAREICTKLAAAAEIVSNWP